MLSSLVNAWLLQAQERRNRPVEPCDVLAAEFADPLADLLLMTEIRVEIPFDQLAYSIRTEIEETQDRRCVGQFRI